MSKDQLQQPSELEDFSRGKIVSRAIKLVPIVKYAVAVAAMAALIATIHTYGVASPGGVFAMVIMIVLMVPVYVFDKWIPKIPSKQAVAAAAVLMWFCLMLFMATGVLLLWAAFVDGQVRNSISQIADDVSSRAQSFFEKPIKPEETTDPENTLTGSNRILSFNANQISESRFQVDVKYEFDGFLDQKTGKLAVTATGESSDGPDPTAELSTTEPTLELGLHQATLILTYEKGTKPLSFWTLGVCMVFAGRELSCPDSQHIISGLRLIPVKQLKPGAPSPSDLKQDKPE